MRTRSALRRAHILAAFVLISSANLKAQYLLLDHGLSRMPAGPQRDGAPEPATGFVADRLSIGQRGEIWVIDALRMWARIDTASARLDDLFQKFELFGGLEAGPPKPGELECDCHNLVALQSANLQTGANGVDGAGMRLSRIAASVWQFDFRGLNWSVPGGVAVQFGLAGVKRANGATAKWSIYTVRTGAAHEIKVFDSKGKFLQIQNAGARDAALGFAVQVWGHLPVAIDIQPRTDSWEVKLQNATQLHAEQGSFRFGPRGATPASMHAEETDLVMLFPGAETGIRPGDVNACLSGRRSDGVPFEGCDLLKRPPR